MTIQPCRSRMLRKRLTAAELRAVKIDRDRKYRKDSYQPSAISRQ